MLTELLEKFEDVFQPASEEELDKRSSDTRKDIVADWVTTAEDPLDVSLGNDYGKEKSWCGVCRRKVSEGESIIHADLPGYEKGYMNICQLCIRAFGEAMTNDS